LIVNFFSSLETIVIFNSHINYLGGWYSVHIFVICYWFLWIATIYVRGLWLFFQLVMCTSVINEWTFYALPVSMILSEFYGLEFCCLCLFGWGLVVMIWLAVDSTELSGKGRWSKHYHDNLAYHSLMDVPRGVAKLIDSTFRRLNRI
jgi:hypothetical protein